MIIRVGFVSNSSSSSFVIPKKVMLPNDVKKLSNVACNYSSCCDTEITESEMYFYGHISIHDDILTELVKKYCNHDGVEWSGG